MVIFGVPVRSGEGPLAVAKLEREEPVDFAREVLPIFRRSCIACHSASKARGGLVLETPESVRAGGDSGPAVEPGRPDESLLFILASHRDEPIMPPRRNAAGASDLDPAELGILARWIEEGALGSASATESSTKLDWQAIPDAVAGPIFAVAASTDGRFAACGRGVRISIYDLGAAASTSDEPRASEPIDPAVAALGIYPPPGAPHLDFVQALEFAPDASWLASAGYRTVKLWRRGLAPLVDGAAGEPPSAIAFAADGERMAVGFGDGRVRMSMATASADRATGDVALTAHRDRVVALEFTA
ncbi:MAG TPA: c-type cytochrome domain-containing protein, partial [Planctomycetota bacterium]|nr:c-type cytochrome domain-containing protein [Planctomycetota bacterium]